MFREEEGGEEEEEEEDEEEDEEDEEEWKLTKRKSDWNFAKRCTMIHCILTEIEKRKDSQY